MAHKPLKALAGGLLKLMKLQMLFLSHQQAET